MGTRPLQLRLRRRSLPTAVHRSRASDRLRVVDAAWRRLDRTLQCDRYEPEISGLVCYRRVCIMMDADKMLAGLQWTKSLGPASIALQMSHRRALRLPASGGLRLRRAIRSRSWGTRSCWRLLPSMFHHQARSIIHLILLGVSSMGSRNHDNGSFKIPADSRLVRNLGIRNCRSILPFNSAYSDNIKFRGKAIHQLLQEKLFGTLSFASFSCSVPKLEKTVINYGRVYRDNKPGILMLALRWVE